MTNAKSLKEHSDGLRPKPDALATFTWDAFFTGVGFTWAIQMKKPLSKNKGSFGSPSGQSMISPTMKRIIAQPARIYYPLFTVSHRTRLFKRKSPVLKLYSLIRGILLKTRVGQALELAATESFQSAFSLLLRMRGTL